MNFVSKFEKLHSLNFLQFLALSSVPNGLKIFCSRKFAARGELEMNNISLKLTKCAWYSFAIGMSFLCSLIEHTQCAQDAIKEADSHSIKQVAYSPVKGEPLTEEHAYQFMSLLPYDAQICVVSNLPKVQQCEWRLVSKKYNRSMDAFFFGPVYDSNRQIMAFSSEISSGTIGENIFNILRNARHRIIIASDKCTNEEFLDDLLNLYSSEGKTLEIRIVTGEDRQTEALLRKEKYSGRIIYHSIPCNRDENGKIRGKMHNKFIIIDDEFVITGSPNFTYAAYNYNIESFVNIRHRFIAGLYFRYYEYIVSGKDKYDNTQDEYKRVEKMMQVFNAVPNNQIQVCLAPILDIRGFVIHGLSDSQVVDINMFLISRLEGSSQSNDIVESLLRACRDEAEITIKVDAGQYQLNGYMPLALAPLQENGVVVYTVLKRPERIRTRTKPITTIPQFHDKLVLIQHKDNSKKVFIGSAGFTENVQDNLNLENMILLRMPVIYDLLLDHFNAVNSSRDNLVVTKL